MRLTDCRICKFSNLFAYLTGILDFDDGMCF